MLRNAFGVGPGECWGKRRGWAAAEVRSPGGSAFYTGACIVGETLPSQQGGRVCEDACGFKVPSPLVRTGNASSLASPVCDFKSPTATTPTPRDASTAGNSPTGGKTFKTPARSSTLSGFSPSSSLSSFSSPVYVPKGGKITPPMCGCGRRARRKLVSTPGPNEGKPFYVCPNNSRGRAVGGQGAATSGGSSRRQPTPLAMLNLYCQTTVSRILFINFLLR